MSDLAEIDVQGSARPRSRCHPARDGRASHLPQRRGITRACLDGLHANGSRPRASEISAWRAAHAKAQQLGWLSS